MAGSLTQALDALATGDLATRILARAWVEVIWRCWQDRTPYDPARHGALQRMLEAPAM